MSIKDLINGNSVDMTFSSRESVVDDICNCDIDNFIVFSGTTATELNQVIAAAGERDCILLTGNYSFTETVEINNKNGLKIIGAGRTTIGSTALPAFYIHDCKEFLEINGITVYHNITPDVGYTDATKYAFRVVGNIYMNFINMRVVGTRYGFYLSNNWDCNFEKLYFHQGNQVAASENTDIVGIYSANLNNSSRFVQCGTSIAGDIGYGYIVSGSDARDLLFENCESSYGGVGFWYNGANAEYANNVHLSNCYWDTSAEIGMIINGSSIDRGVIVVDNCYFWPRSMATHSAFIQGRGVSLISCEIHDKPILVEGGSERIAITNSHFINATLSVYSTKLLNVSGNNFVYNDSNEVSNCALISGCYGSVIGNNFANYNESINLEYDINLDTSTPHNIYYAGNYTQGLFYHAIGIESGVSPIVNTDETT